MADTRNPDTSSRSGASPDANGTLVTWTASTGDATKSHVVHVNSAGMAWALNLKEEAAFQQLAGQAKARPAEAPMVIAAHPGGRRLPREQLARVAYTYELNQLTVVDKAGKKQHIAYGKNGEQGKIFEAVGRHLGGKASEEDADAWSVMQVPLLALAVVSVIGGLFIFLAASADPEAEITGRRAGLQRLINWLGYTIGPVWMSVIFGAIALLILSFMIFLLIRRPKRQVLEF